MVVAFIMVPVVEDVVQWFKAASLAQLIVNIHVLHDHCIAV